MWQTLVKTARRLVTDLNRTWAREQAPVGRPRRYLPAVCEEIRPLRRVTLTDEVTRTLFEEYAAHRRSERGDEETGWVLLGLREADGATVLATLPAGMEANAGVAHVAFNSEAQAIASRIVRQTDRRLRILGVVHTHPGSLRHPSDGDYRGDSTWVGQLRGAEGVFGIGTADAGGHRNGFANGRLDKANVQTLGALCFTWYALAKGDHDYRPVPYALTLGPDLARPLHPLWSTIEAYAEQLERLYCQHAGAMIEVATGQRGPALSLTLPLVEPQRKVCVVIEGNDVRYFLADGEELSWVHTHEPRVDRAVYLLLAELAANG